MKIIKVIFLVCLCSMFSCDLDDPTTGVAIDKIISLSVSNDKAILANGQSALDLTVHLGSAVSADQEVTFKTDQGTFAGTGPDDNRKEIKVKTTEKTATVQLIADVIPNENVTVSAIVGGVIVSDVVEFRPARPTAIFLASDKLVIKPDRTDFSTFDIEITRDEGSGETSSGLIITVTSTVNEGDLALDIVPFVTSNEGKATFKVRSANESEGKVTITVSTSNATGGMTSTSRDIEFKM